MMAMVPDQQLVRLLCTGISVLYWNTISACIPPQCNLPKKTVTKSPVILARCPLEPTVRKHRRLPGKNIGLFFGNCRTKIY